MPRWLKGSKREIGALFSFHVEDIYLTVAELLEPGQTNAQTCNCLSQCLLRPRSSPKPSKASTRPFRFLFPLLKSILHTYCTHYPRLSQWLAMHLSSASNPTGWNCLLQHILFVFRTETAGVLSSRQSALLSVMAQITTVRGTSSWLLHISYMLAYQRNSPCSTQGDDTLNTIYISPVPSSSERFHLFGTRAMSLSSKPLQWRVEPFLCNIPFCMCRTQDGCENDGGLILHSSELHSADI